MPSRLNDVVGDAVELEQSRANDLEVELLWHPGEGIPTLIFDPEGIHRAVLNVLANAVDAVGEMEQPGRVEVRTEYAAAEQCPGDRRGQRRGHPAGADGNALQPFCLHQKRTRHRLGAAGQSENSAKSTAGGLWSAARPGKAAFSPSNCRPSCRKPARQRTGNNSFRPRPLSCGAGGLN